jgi:hypothetical protein
MPELSLDFTWYKDAKGYRLKPAKPLKRRPGQSILDAKLGDIREAQAEIVRKGGSLQRYRPLEVFPNLFRRFVEVATSEKGVMGFVEKFGPLTHDGLRGKAEVVAEVIDQAQSMSEVLRGEIVAMPLSRLVASIETDRNGKIRLKVRPACLLDALWLQLALAKSVSKFRECRQCQKSFMAGRGTDRRADAKFCSVECKTRYFSLKRSR